GYGRSEVAGTQYGDPTYEGGAAFGTPIIENKLAFRVSGWYRRDGGWVDRTNWDRTTRTSTGDVESNAKLAERLCRQARSHVCAHRCAAHYAFRVLSEAQSERFPELLERAVR